MIAALAARLAVSAGAGLLLLGAAGDARPAAEAPADSALVQVSPARPLPAGQRRVLTSRVLGEERPLRLYLPEDYARSNERYAVLCVLDGDMHAGLAAEVARHLRLNGKMPPVIVAGVSNVDRDRDFTPFPVDSCAACGGGERFRRFLREELLPWLDREYRTLPMRIVFGHSLTGSFAVHALLAEPDLFDACIAASPALYYDQGRLLRDLEARLPQRPRRTQFLYLAVADELAYPEAVAFLTGLFDTRPPDGLRWLSREHPDLSHATVPLRVLPDGLLALYEGWTVTQAVFDGGHAAVVAHYRALSERLGYVVEPPESVVNALGYQAIAHRDLDEAVRLFALNVANHPRSWNAYDSLAEAHLRRGDRDKAIFNYRKSLALNPDNANAAKMLAGIR